MGCLGVGFLLLTLLSLLWDKRKEKEGKVKKKGMEVKEENTLTPTKICLVLA